MEELKGRYLVLGLGKSGAAAARYLARASAEGADLTVAAVDSGDDADLRAVAAELRGMGVEVALGQSSFPGGCDVVVTSPGIPPSSPLLAGALEAEVPVLSEIELAFLRSAAPIAAVTGTNGKTTTTSLLAHLLSESGIPAEPVGNIGPPLIGAVASAGPGMVLVAEVSSFQLEFTHRFAPRMAVLLNITPDHLDWHGGMAPYSAAKAKVFANQGPDDTAVVYVDDEVTARLADEVEELGVRVRRVSLAGLVPSGASVVEGRLTVDGDHGPIGLCTVDELVLRGEHNVINALCAAVAALALGGDPVFVADGLRSFRPVEHRLEPVEVVGGAEWFNDSKATNPDAALKALAAFEGQPVVMLLGGRNKETDFRPLAEECAARCKAVVAFGEVAPEIVSAFQGLDVPLRRVAGLADAVDAAYALAETGDVVLLSPAAKSFDEFESYSHRGQVFKRLVLEKAALT